MMSDMHHRADDGGAWFYQSVGAGGETYLKKNSVEHFHEFFAMSARGKDCLRIALWLIKDELRELVKPLLVDNSNIHRGPEDAKPGYLTCCEVEDDELPWLVAQDDDKAVNPGRV